MAMIPAAMMSRRRGPGGIPETLKLRVGRDKHSEGHKIRMMMAYPKDILEVAHIGI
jgi:hypothetical protein